MPTLHQESENREVLGKIKEAIEQRIGSDRFQLWFGDRVRFDFERDTLWLRIDGEFALERLKGHYQRQVEAAAADVVGGLIPVRMSLLETGQAVVSSSGETAEAEQPAALLEVVAETGRPASRHGNGLGIQRGSQRVRERGAELGRHVRPADQMAQRSTDVKPTRSIRVTEEPPSAGAGSGRRGRSPRGESEAGASTLAFPAIRAAESGTASGGTGNSPGADQPVAPGSRRVTPMTFGTYLRASSNTLAVTAAEMLATDPAGSAPLCFWGATGTGKTHLLSAIRHELRARHGLARVILLSAEHFTNDFLSCVRGTGLPAFRKRYRDADALLLDNVQFVGGKNATLRELLYTIDAVTSRGRPLVLAADRQPLEIDGLGGDLAGRMSSGLVLGINPMERELRRDLFRHHARQSFLPWDDSTIEWLSERTIGDGRVIQGISQLVSMLQRMYRRMPTFQEISSHAGEMLQRGPKVVALADVERAICKTFGISTQELRSEAKSRNVSHPRILAMYLSREHTTAAFSEIGRYYGDRNHSTVIAAHRRVEQWLEGDQTLGGRGPKNLKVQEAISAVENLLRIG